MPERKIWGYMHLLGASRLDGSADECPSSNISIWREPANIMRNFQISSRISKWEVLAEAMINLSAPLSKRIA
jgi:hypothetical protein